MALLLAVGAVLKVVTPPLGGISPNWIVALFTLAVLLVKPTYAQGIGLGLVAGAVGMTVSKAPIPWFLLVSEPAAALVAVFLVRSGLHRSLRLGAVALGPLVVSALVTFVSGLVFVGLTALFVPAAVFAAMITTVVVVSAVNAVITEVLYLPSARLLRRGEA
nr:tryptophan transporter [Limnochorda pilosa]